MDAASPKAAVRRASAREPEEPAESPARLIQQICSFVDVDEDLLTVWSPAAKKPSPVCQVLSVLGSGSFAQVYLAKHKDQVVAVKAISRSALAKHKTLHRAATEIYVLRNHSSPFVVPLVDLFKTAHSICLVLELQQGGELYELFRRRGERFKPSSARFYAAECLLAVEELHRLHVAYRDLKMENVLVSASGHVKLCDFGLSKRDMTECDAGASSFVGSVEYLAPELLVAGSKHGLAVDWWALGVLLYELMDGLPPFFSDSSAGETMNQIVNGEADYEDLPSDAVSTLQGLLNKNPRSRLGSRGAAEIKQSAFFAAFPFEQAQQLPPPVIPSLADKLDTSMFSSRFTKMPAWENYNEDDDDDDECAAIDEKAEDALLDKIPTLELAFC